MNSRVITPTSPEWSNGLPELGAEMQPHRLFVSGLPLPPHEHAVAVVGSRRPTAAGIDAAEQLTRGLAEAGFAIVSGLAMGIDTIAHRVALEVGVQTVAVLGCGLDVNYPGRNSALKKKILERGTVVTEYEPGTAPAAHNFPKRNRIIAGLAKGVLFVEGGLASGGRITARHALDANRAVYAVPGSFRNPMGEGPNELIRTSEALLVTSAKHIFDDLARTIVWPDPPNVDLIETPTLEDGDRVVLDYLDDTPVPMDRLITDLEIQPGRIGLILARLEVQGMIVRRSAGYEIASKGARLRGALT